MRPTFTFRQAQAVFDLCHAARPGLSEEDAAWVLPRMGRFADRVDEPVFDRLFERREEPAALAVLLADALQFGWCRGLLDIRDLTVVGAPDALRAALVNGWRVGMSLGVFEPLLPPPEYRIPTHSATTQGIDEVLPPLKALARSLVEPELTQVAQADYGDEVDRHRRALLRVLREQECVFTEHQTWYPSEVVELVAHVPGEPGFVPCTALLLVNAVLSGDERDWFGFRWERLAQAYQALPLHQRGPILNGIRYLYESNPEFLAYAEGTFDPLDRPERMIPQDVT